MFGTRLPANSFLNVSDRKSAQSGYALLFVLLFMTAIAMIMMFYQLGNARNDRYQVYYALGQEFAMVARATHTYVQDHAYFTPYIESADNAEQAANLAYFNSVLETKIDAYRQPLGDQDIPSNNVITLDDLRQDGIGYGFLDTGMQALETGPLRGVEYTFRAHGGLLPMGAPEAVRAASALLVMYGREVNTSGTVVVRTMADMAAFRAGAASNGLNRVGIVLPPPMRAGLQCRGAQAIVSWGNNDSDCLTDVEANAIGIVNLDTFDVVAPAWESVERQLSRELVFRRPHPGLHGMNVMQDDIRMGEGSNNFRIVDAVEIYTQTVNNGEEPIAASSGNTFLQIGQGADSSGAPAADDDAMLTVGYGNNTRGPGVTSPGPESVCPGGATTCFTKDLEINGDMAISFKPSKKDPRYDPDDPHPRPPEGTDMLAVDGVVEVATGDVTVTARADDDKTGFFDVKSKDGTSTSTFNINKQDESGEGGTVINKKVTLGTFNVTADDNTENFIVDKDLIINGGSVTIGNGSRPAQVVLTNADLKSATGTKLDIDTTGKGDASGVFGSDSEIADFEQTGTEAMTFKNLHFSDGADGKKSTVNIRGAVNVDPNNKFDDFDCIGNACPDQVSEGPEGDPM